MIGRLSELLVSGNRAGFMDVSTSPRSPLEYRIQSPRGLKNYDIGGVGLGIVAALEKSCSDGTHEILAKYAICSPNMNRSDPIPVNSGKRCNCGVKEMEVESLEDYTYVTSHGPDKSLTKVYYDNGNKRMNDRVTVVSMARESPARFSDEFALYPTSDFLSSCHLCKKKLHGKDIYMYRYLSGNFDYMITNLGKKFIISKIWSKNDKADFKVVCIGLIFTGEKKLSVVTSVDQDK